MATAIDLEPVIIVRELASGGVYAHPLAEPSLAARGTSREAVLDAQARFLSKYLATVPAATLAEYTRPIQTRMLDVEVVVPRGDLPRRIGIESSICVPCLVIPHRASFWVHILPLGTFAYVETEENLERVVREEVVKAACVQDLSPSEYMAILPPVRHALERVSISVERQDAADQGARASDRRKQSQSREKAAAIKLLAEVGTDLRKAHHTAPRAPVLGRDAEIDALQSLMGGSDRLSAVLVGKELSGKSAVLQGLVARAADRKQPDPLGGRPLIATSGAQLVAGQSGFGELDQRILDVMKAAEMLDAIIVFDNLGDLLSGRPGSIEDLVSGMVPFIANDRVRVIGELTPEQLSHYEKVHVGFLGAMSRVTVEPMDKAATRSVLEARLKHVQTFESHRPCLSAEAVVPLLDLCERYLAYEAFPGKAVRLHDELRSVHEAEVDEQGAPKPIGAGEVYQAFSTRSGIPMFLLKDDRAMKFEQIERFFAQRVIGQREAVQRVAQTLCMVKANLQPPAKPLSNFLFIGPTGVGKTEVAKTLARFLFGSGDRMVRFDMSEYMDPLAAERLIRGTQRDEGELTKRVRQQPFCVVLLDEIEKAHPAVFDLLLQVCGEGRLSDARGRTTWFNNAIIIMTSNLGAAHRRPSAGFGATEGDDDGALARYYLEQVDKHFRPEFVNRIDRVIPFSPLARDEVVAVAEVALRRIVERDGLLGRTAQLTVSPAALQHVAEAGYSPEYGARALRRHLESALVSPLSALMSAYAHDLDGAVLDLRRQDEEPARSDDVRTVAATARWDGCTATLLKPLSTQRRAVTHDLSLISNLRRMADRCLHTRIVEVMEERIEYLVADLAGTDAKKVAGGEYGALAAERARLSELLRAAQEQADAVAMAEDLAMSAQLEGASAALFLDEAQLAFAAFERAFVRMVSGFTSTGECSFLVRAFGVPVAMPYVLRGFFAGAEARGWTVTVHRVGDPKPEDGWPAGRYGAPRTVSWCRDQLDADELAKTLKHWQAVLIRVRGSMAGGLLEREMGLWRFDEGPFDKTLIELLPMADRYDAKPSELCRAPAKADKSTEKKGGKPPPDPFAIPEQQGAAIAQKQTPVRLWEMVKHGAVVSTDAPTQSFPVQDAADYWDALERVQFAEVAGAALVGKDDA
ncbi:MAG: AAA family ATPase [Myxococcota bacterium]